MHVYCCFQVMWNQTNITLTSLANSIISFVGVRGGSFVAQPYGDMAIDDIFIYSGPCLADVSTTTTTTASNTVSPVANSTTPTLSTTSQRVSATASTPAGSVTGTPSVGIVPIATVITGPPSAGTVPTSAIAPISAAASSSGDGTKATTGINYSLSNLTPPTASITPTPNPNPLMYDNAGQTNPITSSSVNGGGANASRSEVVANSGSSTTQSKRSRLA